MDASEEPGFSLSAGQRICSVVRSPLLSIYWPIIAGIAVAGFGIAARTNSDYAQTAHVVKASKVMTVTSSDASLVR